MEDLLKPRFEIIADYPNNDFGKVGTIIDRDWRLEGGNNSGIAKISDYPNIFRKLNWWEKREESEMPMYLKDNEKIGGGKVTYYKIEKWNMELMLGIIENGRKEVCSILTWTPEYTYQPATEEEYLNSLK